MPLRWLQVGSTPEEVCSQVSSEDNTCGNTNGQTVSREDGDGDAPSSASFVRGSGLAGLVLAALLASLSGLLA